MNSISELIKALETLQKHCDNTLCVNCIFNRAGVAKAKDYCRLCADFPAYWDTLISELNERSDDNGKT